MALTGRLLMPRHLKQHHCLCLAPVSQSLPFSPGLLSPRPHPIKVPRATRVTIFQAHKKAGYGKEVAENKLKLAIDGLKMLKSETKLFLQEWKVKLENDAVMDRDHLDHTYLFHFSNQEDVNKWVVTCDSDHGEGSSTANFELNRNGNGLFHGHLSTKIPKDGIIKDAGYANIRSPRLLVSIYLLHWVLQFVQWSFGRMLLVSLIIIRYVLLLTL